MDNRAVTPVVGKVLAAGLAVLYIAGMSSLLLGGVVPEYRETAGEELAERVLANVAGHVERAMPETDATVDVHVNLELPATIRDRRYRLLVRSDRLVLDHPDDALDVRTHIELPSKVSVIDGSWKSGGTLDVHVSGPGQSRKIALEEGKA